MAVLLMKVRIDDVEGCAHPLLVLSFSVLFVDGRSRKIERRSGSGVLGSVIARVDTSKTATAQHVERSYAILMNNSTSHWVPVHKLHRTPVLPLGASNEQSRRQELDALLQEHNTVADWAPPSWRTDQCRQPFETREQFLRILARYVDDKVHQEGIPLGYCCSSVS